MKTIAREARCCVRQVKYSLRRLEKVGYIRILQYGKNKGPKPTANVYEILRLYSFGTKAQVAQARIENEELFQATASERKDAMRKWHAAAAKTKAKRSSGTNKLVHPGALIGGQS